MNADQPFDYRVPGEVSQMWLDVWGAAPERARSAASKAALRVIETFAGDPREALERIWESRNPSTMVETVRHFHAACNAGVPTAAVNATAFSAFHPSVAAVHAVLYFGNRSIREALEERQHQRRDLTGQAPPPLDPGSEPADEQPITDEPHTPDTNGEE